MIREANRNDLSAIERIAENAYTPYIAAIGKAPAPMEADFASQIEEGIIEVYVTDAGVQGYCVSFPEKTAWHVENLAVDPTAQGSGIGQALLKSAEAQAAHWGIGTVELYTNVAMEAALKFYPKIGYVELYRREQDGFQRAFFRKDLK